MMKLHLRIATGVIIAFILYVSYKILEPEISFRSSELEGSGQFLSKQVAKLADPAVKERIRYLKKRYILDWHAQLNGSSPWTVAAGWVTSRQIHPDQDHRLGGVLRELSKRRIDSADVGYKGSQLKITLELHGGQRAVFKPKWYSRDHVITGLPYDGADRHNAEVVAFHLGRLLGYDRTPLVVGRRVNLETEIKPVATQRLLDTFFIKDDNTCFYGRCLYCKDESDGVCGEGVMMEGAVVLWLPDKWELDKRIGHPWGRSYRDGVTRRWESDDTYCDTILAHPMYSSGPRLLDIMDAAVSDYLMGNADRHHYEVYKGHPDSIMLMLDSGKSFGNPYVDERSILAPITQCCRLRRTTWQRLLMLQDGVLSTVLRRILDDDPITPLLSDLHYTALDRRLEHVIHAIHSCISHAGNEDSVFITDNYS